MENKDPSKKDIIVININRLVVRLKKYQISGN